MADCGFKKINQVKEQPLLYLRLGQIQILQKYNFSLTRLSKENYYQSFFDLNICNMRQIWKGIKELIGNCKRKTSAIQLTLFAQTRIRFQPVTRRK